MPKRTVYVVVGLVTVVVAAAAACLVVLSRPGPTPEGILAAYRNDAQYSELTIDYPLDETLFPPKIAPPIFRWTDGNSKSDTWLITIDFEDGQGRVNSVVRERQWAPETAIWEAMKNRSLEKDAKVTVIGVNHWRPGRILSAGRIRIKTQGPSLHAGRPPRKGEQCHRPGEGLPDGRAARNARAAANGGGAARVCRGSSLVHYAHGGRHGLLAQGEYAIL